MRFILILIFITSLMGCTHDYRTDQEVAMGVVLTEQQIQWRKIQDQYEREQERRWENERRFRQALRDCWNTSIVVCL